MNTATKAGVIALLIAGLCIIVISFMGDSMDGPDFDPGPGTGASTSTQEETRPEVKLPERPKTLVSVQGIVRDNNGTPLPQARVMVSRYQGGEGVGLARVDETQAGADGRFSFSDLIPGMYRFKAELRGYQGGQKETMLVGDANITQEEIVLVLSSGMSISGRILDPAGSPVVGAQVAGFKERVEQDAPLQTRLQVLLNLEEMQQENGIVAVTDGNGRYEVVGLENISYRLQTVASGFSPAEKRYIPAGSTDVDFFLELGGTLSGNVSENGGAPVADALVEIYRQTGTMDIIEIIQERAFPPLASRMTDGSGQFEFNELGGDSEFRLVVRADGYQPRQFEKLTVLPGGAERVDVILDRGLVIEGTVYDPEGNALAGARCKINPMGTRTEGPPIELTDDGLETDESGNFRFDTLDDLDYRLVVSFPDFATHQQLRIRPSGEPLNIQLTEGAAISGGVFDAETSAPIAGAMVMVNDVADVKKSAVTDSSGLYYVRGVTEQRRPIAFLNVDAKGYMRSGNVEASVTEGTETTGQDFYLQRNGVVRGVCIDANGQPLPGVSVSARKMHSEQNPVVVNAAPPVTSAEDGSFEITEVSPGSGMFVEGTHSQYLTSQSDNFDLMAGGSIENLTLTMKIGGQISGIVIDESGVPLEGAVVAVRDEWLGDVNPESLPNKTVSDAAGQFSLRSLSAGYHNLICSNSGYLTVEMSEIAVEEGMNTANIELKLTRGATLEGYVTDLTGEPIEGARVVAIDTSDGLRKISKNSDLTGRFSFDNLGRFPVDLAVEKNGFADVRLFEVAVDGQPITVQLEALGGMRGVVLQEDGTPLRAFSVSPRIYEGDRELTKVPARTFQSEDGFFQFDGLEPGLYNVIIGAPGFAQAKIEGVTIRSSQWVDIQTVRLGQGGRVLGQIIDATTNQPVAGAKVSVIGGIRNFLTNSIQSRGGGRKDQVMTGPDGFFEFIGLSAPQVDLKVEHRAYIGETVRDVLSGTADLVVAIGSGGIIEGRVVDGADFVAGVQVLLSGGGKGTDSRTQTDRKGFFTFPGLPSGTYTLRVTSFGTGDRKIPLDQAPTAQVSVDAGSSEYIEFDLGS
ncbi:MAG: hypothetical protein CBC13_11285 [Planctomycetia bacterium TMED53]|nr:MAG: hypothetical protein CBC13_11285 [Planctomycetia bacterium TMED53]